MRTLSRAPAGSRPPRGRGRGRRREQGRQHRVALIRLLQRRQRRAGAEGHAGVGTLHLRKSARSSTSTTSSATKWTRISLHQRRRRFHRKKTLAQKAPASVTPIRRPQPGPSTWCFHGQSYAVSVVPRYTQERVSDSSVQTLRLPFWSYAKLLFNCWLVLPKFNGAAHVYGHFVRPMIEQNGSKAFENLVNKF